MIFQRSAIAMGLAALVWNVSASAQQDAVETLDPIGPWSVNLGEDHCALSRNFGDPQAPVIFDMRQYAPGAPYSVVIMRQSNVRSSPEPSLYFGPIDDLPNTGRASLLELDGYSGVRALVFGKLGLPDSIFLAEEDVERDAGERAFEWLHVGQIFESDFRLRTGEMHAVLSIMRDCQAELVSRWGLDIEEQRQLTSNAEIDFEEHWISQAMRNISLRPSSGGRTQTIYLLLFSDSGGEIIECRPLSPQDDEAVATRFCEVAVRRGRTVPATNAAGQPVASTVVFGFGLGSVSRSVSF